MPHLTFFYDATSCVGCKACQIACKDRNRIMDPGITFRTLKSYEAGAYPAPQLYHFAETCNHCVAPACLAACPVDAIAVAEDSTVQIDQEVCTGCQQCVEACPYGAPKYFPDTGTARKCDACKDQCDAGRNAVCVDACPMRALDFGEQDVLTEKYGPSLVSSAPVWPDGGTGAKVLVRPKTAMDDAAYRPVSL
jgi:anaerobic dimethyl sulfoxide reductase subunit B (iron-sulfur subunit)